MSPEYYALRSFRSSTQSTPDITNSSPLIPLQRNENESSDRRIFDLKNFLLIVAILGLIFFIITLTVDFNLDVKDDLNGFGAIVSSGPGCEGYAGEILRENGSVADAAIVTLLCDGITLPHSLGIGGGFVATIYTKATGRVKVLTARETAPIAATENMFVGKGPISGALAVAVPAEIHGYWKLHQKYGKLPWKSLFTHAIEMCRNGHIVNKQLATSLATHSERIKKEPTMADIFINSETNEVFKEGDILYRPKLADTLQIIAEEGLHSLYGGGSLGKVLVEDIQEMGGIITEEDLKRYRETWEDPVVTQFTSEHKLYTTPLPTSGVVLAYILNIMKPLVTTNEDVYWQRLMEAFKHAYGHRTRLGDVHFEPEVEKIFKELLSQDFALKTRDLIRDDQTFENFKYYGANFSNIDDHGTANIIILAPNGDAIVATSSVNSHFGAKIISRRTGIILNDHMDDFSTPGLTNVYGIPASPANYIKPGKRPMSSMCPAMVFDNHGNLQMMVAGAGGSRITTSVAQVILRYFVLNQTIGDALDAGRMHHQLIPMRIDVESSVPEHTTKFLERIGHKLNLLPHVKIYSSLTALGMKPTPGLGNPQPATDPRRPGGAVIIKN